MTRWIDRLEWHVGDWAVHHFALFIVMANGLIYLLSWTQPGYYSRLVLDPAAVWSGEIWRIFTFLFVPPLLGPLGMVFWLLLLYQYGQALENEWGNFRFFVYYIIGAIATAIAGLWIARETLSNVPLNTTIFLAFANLFPDFQLLLFFILPVKVKYLAWLVWLGFAWSLVIGSNATRVTIAAALVNYTLFFGPQHWETVKLKWEVYRNRKRFR